MKSGDNRDGRDRQAFWAKKVGKGDQGPKVSQARDERTHGVRNTAQPLL